MLGRDMDLSKVLEQLRAELAALDEAIASLEKLGGAPPRRSRPPKSRNEAKHPLEFDKPQSAARNND
jgi:hypothetical protein